MGEETKMPQKAGYKSTEFWLSLLAALVGFVLASGAVVEGSQTATIVGGVLTVLCALGYTKGRTAVKVAAEKTKAEESKIVGYIELAKAKVDVFRESRLKAEAEREAAKAEREAAKAAASLVAPISDAPEE